MPRATREEFMIMGHGAPPADLDAMSAEQRGSYNFQRMLRAFGVAGARAEAVAEARAARVQAG